MDRAVIRALLFPLCMWVLYGFQPEGVRLPDMLNLGSSVESEITPEGFEVIARELPLEPFDRSMAPNEVVRMNDFCFAVDSDQAAGDVERDGRSFLAADFDGCAGVETAAIELVVHLVHPLRAVALDVAGAVNSCGAKPVLEIVVDAGASQANVTGNSTNSDRPDTACLAHAVGFGFLPPLPV